ncbi:energy transducer TonB [Ideonella livida]|uniref:TonB family protein n=1 Tax=Ideonella livida TaxID=2707176 RepID=A0A7C9PGE4_9BURK|nr:energy transducer TonB [Ideonella livida]NDY91297.1 TonB family protein [Ideonella livida]
MGLAVLAAHGLVMAWAWQTAATPPTGGRQPPAATVAAGGAPPLLWLNLPPAPTAATPMVASPRAPQDVTAPPARADRPGTTTTVAPTPQGVLPPQAVQVAATFARVDDAPAVAPRATAAASLPSLEPPAVPGLPNLAPGAKSSLPVAMARVGAASPVPPGGATQAPRALAGNRLPAYPEAAREDALEGTVGLLLLIDEQGRVTQVQWTRRSGAPLLDHAAAEAARAWRFTPALREGQPVAGQLSLAIRFQLDAAPLLAQTLVSRETP